MEGHHAVEQAKRDKLAKDSLQKDIDFARWYYSNQNKIDFNNELINLATGAKVNFQAEDNLAPASLANGMVAPPAQHHFLNDGTYALRGNVFTLETIKNAAGEETGVRCYSNRIPENKKDAENLYGSQMDFIILGKGCRSFKFEIRQTNPEVDPYHLVMELKAVMDEAEKRKVTVNFGPYTQSRLQSLGLIKDLERGYKIRGGTMTPISEMTKGKQPLEYFTKRQEQLQITRSLDEKYTEDYDGRMQKKLTEIPRETESAAYKVLATDADKTAHLKATVAAAANLGASNKDAKLNTINTQITGISKRIDALNKAYEDVAGRVTNYHKLLDDNKSKAWEIKKMFAPNAAGEERTKELMSEIDKERKELAALLSTWKEILSTAPYDNTAAVPQPTINDTIANLEKLEANAALPPPPPGGVPLSAADAATLKIAKELKKAVDSSDTALAKIDTAGLNKTFKELEKKCEALLEKRPEHRAPGVP